MIRIKLFATSKSTISELIIFPCIMKFNEAKAKWGECKLSGGGEEASGCTRTHAHAVTRVINGRCCRHRFPRCAFVELNSQTKHFIYEKLKAFRDLIGNSFSFDYFTRIGDFFLSVFSFFVFSILMLFHALLIFSRSW